MAITMLVSCRHKKQQETTDTLTSGVIQIAVDDDFKNIVKSEIDVFNVNFPEAFVLPEFFNEQEAISRLINDSVKLAVVGRDLDAYERSKLLQNRVIRKYPFGYEGVAFVINRQNKDSILSYAQIKKIFLGKINTWKEIDQTSPLDTIRIFFVNGNNGIMRYVADSITKGTQNVSKYIYALKDNENIFDKIANNVDYIGVIGINQMGNMNSEKYLDNSQKVRLVRISKKDNAKAEDSYLPYAGDIYNGDYPFWRPIYVLLGETRDGLPKGFCFFLTQQIGQKVVLKAGFMPITDANKTWTRWNYNDN